MPPGITDHTEEAGRLKTLKEKLTSSSTMKDQSQSPPNLPRWNGGQRRIGLTGGIASGKSSIERFLKEKKGLPSIDADLFAREALAPGALATKAVLRRYGDAIIKKSIDNQNCLDRLALRRIIFNNKNERLWLENLIHPIVKERMESEIQVYKDAKVLVLIIPLLFEANFTDICSEFWLVSCNYEQQIKRLIDRDRINIDDAKAIVNNQLSTGYKKSLADFIIDNSGPREAWVGRVESLLNHN